MSSEKTTAIVLRVVDFSETSVVTTLFTEHFGKVSALAKGARRPKGPFDNAIDMLAVARIVFLKKSSGGLDLLTEARLERRFRSAERNLERLYAGYYLAELLLEMTDEGDPHPELFVASNTMLAELDQGISIATLITAFELFALKDLGHLPLLADCALCGNTIVRGARYSFGLLAGGVLCGRCRPGQRQVVSVRTEVIDMMQLLSSIEPAAWRDVTIEPRLAGELRGVMQHYLSHHLGHKCKMHRLLSGKLA